MIERLPPGINTRDAETSPRPVRQPSAPARDFREAVGADQPRPDPDIRGDSGDNGALSRDIAASDLHGAGQAMLLAWQLVPNNALSQMLTGVRVGAETPRPSRADVHAYAVSLVGSRAGAGDGSAVAATPLPGKGTAAALASAIPNSPLPATSSAADTPDAGAVLSSLAERWQARLLRWSEGGNQALSVRIRDYRLDAQGAQSLAERLRAFAGQHGLPLQRIVINARELWRADLTYPRPTGDAHGR